MTETPDSADTKARTPLTLRVLALIALLGGLMCLVTAVWAQEGHGAQPVPPAAAPAAPAVAEAHAPSGHGEVPASHGTAEGHGKEGGHGEEAAKPELPNFITIALELEIGGRKVKDIPHVGHFLHAFEYQIFLVLITVIAAVFIFGTLRLRMVIPGRMQAFLEMIVEGFYNFIGTLMGDKWRKFTPFFGSLFMFIWLNNMFGIVPLFTGATSQIQTTGVLALFVFFYVNGMGIKEGGLKNWLLHLCGNPKDVVGWCMVPMMLPIEIVSLFAKPLSLALRLFGNITGEHILSGVFLILGMMLMGAFWPHAPIGVPLHLPFFFLSLLVGTIQALVFTLLSAIYLMMVLPHEHEHEHEEHGHGAVHG